MFPGVSLITQVLYAGVFCARYLDLFWTSPAASVWNFVLKVFYILSSIYIILVMLRRFPRTREREKSWKLGGICAAGAFVGGPLVTLIFLGRKTSFTQVKFKTSVGMARLTKYSDIVDILHYTRICLRTPSIAASPPDNSAYRNRLLLSRHTWLISSILHFKLDSEGCHA